MASPETSLRQRGRKKNDHSAAPPTESVHVAAKAGAVSNANKPTAPASEWDYKLALAIMTILAFITRFWKIYDPESVVFDEVHFGKFASYYLRRSYFFDVHPPFAKLLFAGVGWLVGYDGHYLFENIGESYIENRVPYVAFRALPATLGSLTVPAVFLIMWESSYSVPACVIASGLVLFDNAHIGEDRLILLDATLVLCAVLSILSYIRFYKLRDHPFSRKWWKWLLLTGMALSCGISTKYVGLFTFVTIGSAVAIDLWGLLDIKRRRGPLTLFEFGKHFAARAFGLIIVPFFFYLFWFQIHFAILTESGPGDEFMSPEFQETLNDNAMISKAVGINYYDVLTIRHKDTRVYLHSHPETYPLRYDDGRISSQGQQVTGYPFNDTNNYWQVLPKVPFEDEGEHIVKNGDIVRLRHLGTETLLLTHDVASPYYPTNQEFTTIPDELAEPNVEETRYEDTLFEISLDNGRPNQQFKTLMGLFRLFHYPSKVAMWTHSKPLPDWGYKQNEINGNKKQQDSSNIWYVEDITSLPEDHPRRSREPRVVKSLPFMTKYLELQKAMFIHNNLLTSSHPYASQPIEWPFMLRGVSFWTNNEDRKQIYFTGNVLGWWISSCLLSVFVGIVCADQLSLRRGIDALESEIRSRLYRSTGFFFLCWASHYFPFYLMGRQLFLHHYLPAHVAASLVAGSLVEFVLNLEPVPHTAKPNHKSLLMIWAAAFIILGILIWSFLFFAPLTYGSPGLDVPNILARKWMNFDLHFAK